MLLLVPEAALRIDHASLEYRGCVGHSGVLREYGKFIHHKVLRSTFAYVLEHDSRACKIGHFGSRPRLQ